MIGPAELATLHRAGLIPPGRYLEAVHRIRDHAFWARWAARALLAAGVVHLLAGIFLFFAFNWAEMPPMAKFAVVEAGILGCLAGAWIAGFDRAVGQSLLIGATILTGVLLKVIGQVYQVDADAFELFLGWAFLVLPWVLASRSPAHWLVWLVLACLAARLFAGQVLVQIGWNEEWDAVLPPVILLIAALAARDVAVAAGAGWLSARWTRQIVLFAALATLYVGAFGYVFEWLHSPLSTVLFVLAIAAGAFVYGRLRPDFAAVTQVISFAGLLLMAVGMRLVGAWIDFDDFWVTLPLLGLLVIWLVAVTGSVAFILPAVRHRLAEDRR